MGLFTLIGKAGFGTKFRKTIQHVLEAHCPLGSPLLLLAPRGISVLKYSIRLFVSGVAYVVSCRWHAWKGASGQI